MALVVITCPVCSKPTRVPDDRGRIRVKCPTCAHTWSYPVVTEHVEIGMKCAVNRQAYQVHFTRANSGGVFRISEITLTESTQAVVPVGQLAGAPARPRPTQSISFNQLSFDGFRCPHCVALGTEKPSPWSTITCNACNQTICTGTMQADYSFRCACGSQRQIDVTLPPITKIDGTMRCEAIEVASQPRLASKPAASLLAGSPKGLLR